MEQLELHTTIAQSMHDYGVIPAPMGPKLNSYVAPTHHVFGMVFQVCNMDLETAIPVLNEWAGVFNNGDWSEYFLDGRLRTKEDEEMFFKYIAPAFTMQEGLMPSQRVWWYSDGMISLISYLGESPMAVIEQHNDDFNDVIDMFFDQYD